MEDVGEEEQVLDIDGVDKNNTLAVVDYVNDLYAHYRRVEVMWFSPLVFQYLTAVGLLNLKP